MQDDTASDSLDPAVTLWLIYAFLSVAVSGTMLVLSGTSLLPAARLAQVQPRLLGTEVERLLRKRGLQVSGPFDAAKEEKRLKSPAPGREGLRWIFLAVSLGIIFIGWIMFGLGVSWGVHGSVIAGTTGE